VNGSGSGPIKTTWGANTSPPPPAPPAETIGPLASLRDVPGVEGSFVVSDLGRLLARDMPPVFGDDVLGEVGPRALRLRDTLSYAGEELDAAMIRYADYLLFIRPLGDGVLCALTAREVHVPAVKMALHLCARALEGRPQPRPTPTPFAGRSRGYGF
jgi:predicted regulator of Ras-like GTPase activity (Roadblock/LC7/MglB family)